MHQQHTDNIRDCTLEAHKVIEHRETRTGREYLVCFHTNEGLFAEWLGQHQLDPFAYQVQAYHHLNNNKISDTTRISRQPPAKQADTKGISHIHNHRKSTEQSDRRDLLQSLSTGRRLNHQKQSEGRKRESVASEAENSRTPKRKLSNNVDKMKTVMIKKGGRRGRPRKSKPAQNVYGLETEVKNALDYLINSEWKGGKQPRGVVPPLPEGYERVKVTLEIQEVQFGGSSPCQEERNKDNHKYIDNEGRQQIKNLEQWQVYKQEGWFNSPSMGDHHEEGFRTPPARPESIDIDSRFDSNGCYKSSAGCNRQVRNNGSGRISHKSSDQKYSLVSLHQSDPSPGSYKSSSFNQMESREGGHQKEPMLANLLEGEDVESVEDVEEGQQFDGIPDDFPVKEQEGISVENRGAQAHAVVDLIDSSDEEIAGEDEMEGEPQHLFHDLMEDDIAEHQMSNRQNWQPEEEGEEGGSNSDQRRQPLENVIHEEDNDKDEIVFEGRKPSGEVTLSSYLFTQKPLKAEYESRRRRVDLHLLTWTEMRDGPKLPLVKILGDFEIDGTQFVQALLWQDNRLVQKCVQWQHFCVFYQQWSASEAWEQMRRVDSLSIEICQE